MGLFNRGKVEEIAQTEVRSENDSVNTNTENDYAALPVGLEFLTPFLGKGEATSISAFFSGVQLISSTIASIPIHVREIESGDIVKHPLDSAITKGVLSKFTLFKQLIWDLYVEGNAIAYIKRSSDGAPTKLIYCPPGSYSIIYNPIKQDLYYLIPSITSKKVEPINVIHLILNSKDGITGKGIPLYARKILNIALATDNHAKNYFENGANIDGILKSSRQMSSQQKLDAKQSWMTVHGAGKQGGIAVLGADWEYTPIGSNSSDSQMLETRKFNAEEVCRYLCIDPILLGISGSTGYNSIEQAQLSFLSHCIYPLISLIESELNRKLIRLSERDTYFIDFDENHIMFADKAATANYYSTLVSSGILSINEARHNLGYKPIDGGDKNVIPFTNLEQNTVQGN